MSNFLSVQAIQYTVDDKGNVKEEKTPIVEHLVIHKNQIDEIHQSGKPPAEPPSEPLPDPADDGEERDI